MKQSKKYKVHLVSHTHWDREWYSTFQEFRIRLVRMFDKLLHVLDTEPEYRYFVFDGKTVDLEDYLEIRPEHREKIRAYVASGRLHVGPWYVQPDEFLVSGESLIRNLLIGTQIAAGFGGVMKIGYQPDPFGHIAQLPQILNGFDIHSAMFARGMGKEAERLGMEFNWQAPDGSSVLAIHLIATKENTGGYSNGAALGYPDRWVRENFDIRLALDSVSTSIGVLEPFARTKNLLLCNGGDFMEPQAELPEVIKYLNKHLPNAHVVHSTYADYIQDVEKHRASLATYAGELRRARFMPLLVNILSSRLYVKQKNFAAQTALEHYAEPLAVFASLAGKAYPAALLTQAWKYFIQTHPHDTICGCSIDKVHEDGLQRAEWSQQISAVLAAQSVDHLLAQHRAGDPRHDGIAVVNTLPWPRREEVVVDGATCLLDVPACGYKIYDRAEVQALASCVSAGSERSLENARVKVEVKANGTLTLTDKATGVTYAGLNYFEDVEDTGDLYTYFPADVSQTISTLQEAAPSVEKRDGKLVISYDLRLPARVEEDYSRRSTEMVACPLTTTVSLAGDSPLVRISTSFENTAKDHRLRVGFQPGIHATASLADGQFQVVERPLGADPEDWIKEPATGESAQQHFVIIRDEQKGLLVANKGLPEYQLTEEGKLYVTLARCVEWINSLGWVNRKVRQLPQNRMGHAPGGQCPGRHTCEYAVMPIAGAWEECLHDVYNYIVPVTVRETHGVPPAEQSYFTLEPQPLLISAIKQAEASDNIIVRIYNPTEKPVSGLLRTFVKPKKAYLTQLNESRIRQLPAKRGGIALEVAPYKIVTLELAFPGKAEKE